MANVGMKMPVYATTTTYTEGAAITYGAGKVMGHAIAANVTANKRNTPLWADNVKVENDQGITDYSISLEIDDIADEDRVALLGEIKNGSDDYSVVDKNPPYVGFGYLTNKIKNGVEKWEGWFYHRVQFSMDGESASTKTENITWQTPKLTGTGFGVILDNSGTIKMWDHMEFTTEAAAIAWLKGKANIT